MAKIAVMPKKLILGVTESVGAFAAERVDLAEYVMGDAQAHPQALGRGDQVLFEAQERAALLKPLSQSTGIWVAVG